MGELESDYEEKVGNLTADRQKQKKQEKSPIVIDTGDDKMLAAPVSDVVELKRKEKPKREAPVQIDVGQELLNSKREAAPESADLQMKTPAKALKMTHKIP